MTDDRVAAVLIPPQLQRFREVCQVAGSDFEVIFTGWSKHVVLIDDRAFLFARNSDGVPALEREANVLLVLESLGVSGVPRLVGRWEDKGISEYPFFATTRLSGDPFEDLLPKLEFEQLLAFFDELGRTLASWHDLNVAALPSWLQDDNEPLGGMLRQMTREESLGAGLERAEALLTPHFPGLSLGKWERAWRELASLSPVLLHGDICENQFLVDQDMRITGVLDWGTAHVGHLLGDFHFGEWDRPLFKWEARFAGLRKSLWTAYLNARGLHLDVDALHSLFTVTEACSVVERVEAHPAPDSWNARHFQRALENLRQIV